MITFETQEDFDKAVMDTLHKYLKVQLFMYEEYGVVRTSVTLINEKSCEDIDSAKDYCTVNSREY